MLFFECMAALFNPNHRRGEGIKWGLVSYTVVMFSLVTVLIAMNLDIQSISFIDNREFPGFDGGQLPGPYGYQWVIGTEAIGVIPTVAFPLTNWMADGLLVRSLLVLHPLARGLTCIPHLALSLLRNLRQETLGRRLPLPHVPQLHGYVSEFSAGPRRHTGLTPSI